MRGAGKSMRFSISDQARMGDHIWWISDVSKFQRHYPEWAYAYDLRKMIEEIVDVTFAKKPFTAEWNDEAIFEKMFCPLAETSAAAAEAPAAADASCADLFSVNATLNASNACGEFSTART